MKDVRGPYFRSLEESDRPRKHWRGIDPDDGTTQWLFETVEEEGRTVAIKQIIVHPDRRSTGIGGSTLKTRQGS